MSFRGLSGFFSGLLTTFAGFFAAIGYGLGAVWCFAGAFLFGIAAFRGD